MLFIENFLSNESISIIFMKNFKGSVINKKNPPNIIFIHIYIIPWLIIVIQFVKIKIFSHQCVFKFIVLAFELESMLKKA
jgi:hypothetical protein